MSDLTEWLLACIAEDEAVARHKGADAMAGHRWKHAPENVYQEIQSEVLDNCRHVLAECEAKRRIVGLHPHELESDDSVRQCSTCRRPGLCGTVRALALPYAGRPGYREEWRP